MLVAAALVGCLTAMALFSLALHALPVERPGDRGRLHDMAAEPRPAVYDARDEGVRRLSAPAEAVSVGRIQRVDLVVGRRGVSPDYISVKAGLPIEVHVRASDRVSLRFPDTTVTVGGGVVDETVLLPALEPGIHSFSRSSGGMDGIIVAR